MIKEEKLKKVFVFLVFVIIALLVSLIFLYLMADMEPKSPEVEEEELDSWLEMIENTVWKIDKSTKQEELEELSFHTVKTISFSQRSLDSASLRCYIETPEMTLMGFVTKGENTLLLSLDGFILELWYSKNKDDEFRTLTLKGKTEWLFFTLNK